MAHWTALFLGRSVRNSGKIVGRPGRKPRRSRVACEPLEGRELLSGVNVDYTLMGGQWNNTQPISFSIAPDGVAWDQSVNNVNARLNAETGGAGWQKLVARALQTWAASANLDFVPAADGPYAFNAPGQGQGDARFGDIRVAGYAFPTATIAQTYGPPPNGWTAAGDVKLNTGYDFGPGGRWDLETTLLHELGHSLGLGESPQAGSVMYSYYNGVRHDLSSFDVEGIQSIYGPRVADAFQAAGRATSAASAVDLGPAFNAAGVAQLASLSLNAIGASEYFSVTAPPSQGAALQVKAIADGQSLMSPKVTVIDAATGATLAADSHPDQYGNTATVTVSGVQPGHRYLIVVTGATQDVFAVGKYTLQAAFSGGSAGAPTSPVATPVATTTPTTPAPAPTSTPTPAPPPAPVMTTPVPSPAPAAPVAADRYAANTSFAAAADLGAIAGQSLVNNVSLASGQDVRVFTFQPARSGLVFLASANATIVVGDAMGRPVASGRGLVGFAAPQAGARYFVIVLSPNNAAVADASFAVQVIPVAAAPPVATPVPAIVTIGQQTPKRTTAAANKAAKAKRRVR